MPVVSEYAFVSIGNYEDSLSSVILRAPSDSRNASPPPASHEPLWFNCGITIAFDLPGPNWSRMNDRLDRNWSALAFCAMSRESFQTTAGSHQSSDSPWSSPV